MGTIKGDFIGFSYNGVHSSELGIVRTSEGSRFNENLLPTIKDRTVQVPGGDGTLYFGSEFTQRQISISFAFDELTEQQLSQIQQLFGDKKVHSLIFDERPYKIYQAKVTGSSTIKYIPFTHQGQRIYKGEGSVQFTCYQPYAICSKKFLNQYENEGIDISEWAEASGLKQAQGKIDIFDYQNNYFPVYNPGVKPSDWRLIINSSSNVFQDLTISINQIGLLKFKGAPVKGGVDNQDQYIVFNSKTSS